MADKIPKEFPPQMKGSLLLPYLQQLLRQKESKKTGTLKTKK